MGLFGNRTIVRKVDYDDVMSSVFVVDACRTPIGKIKGGLAQVRPDHLAAGVIASLTQRNQALDVSQIDDV